MADTLPFIEKPVFRVNAYRSIPYGWSARYLYVNKEDPILDKKVVAMDIQSAPGGHFVCWSLCDGVDVKACEWTSGLVCVHYTPG